MGSDPGQETGGDAPAVIEFVLAVADRLLFYGRCARVSIRWGDPVEESGGGRATRA